MYKQYYYMGFYLQKDNINIKQNIYTLRMSIKNAKITFRYLVSITPK